MHRVQTLALTMGYSHINRKENLVRDHQPARASESRSRGKMSAILEGYVVNIQDLDVYLK